MRVLPIIGDTTKPSTAVYLIVIVVFAIFIFIGLSIITIMCLATPTIIKEMPIFLLGPVTLIIFGIVMPIYALKGIKRISKIRTALSNLASQIKTSEDEVRLPYKMEVEYGFVKIDYYRSRRSSGSSLEVKFEIGGHTSSTHHGYCHAKFNGVRRTVTDRIPFVNEKFSIAFRVFRDFRDVAAELPAVKIASGEYKDILFIFLTNEGYVEGSKTLVLSKDDDIVQVSLKGVGKAIEGEINGTIKNARGVRVEALFCNKFVELASAKSSGVVQKRFVSKVIPDEKMVIILPDVSIDKPIINDFVDLLERYFEPPFVMGHGKYTIKAVLDLPLKKDVVDECTFTVNL